MSKQTDEKMAEFRVLLVDMIRQCDEEPLLRNIDESDLSRTVRSIQKVSDLAYTEVCELMDKMCECVTFPEVTEDDDGDELKDAMERIIFDLLWKSTFKEGKT